MKYSEIKGLSEVELKKSLDSMYEELYVFKVKNRLGQLANPLQIREIKRKIARFKTSVNQAKLGKEHGKSI